MKFYRENKYDYFSKIDKYKLSAIYCRVYLGSTYFFLNGLVHNSKNAYYVGYDGIKMFSLNGQCYGFHNDFNKQSWRRFVRGLKLKAFL